MSNQISAVTSGRIAARVGSLSDVISSRALASINERAAEYCLDNFDDLHSPIMQKHIQIAMLIGAQVGFNAMNLGR